MALSWRDLYVITRNLPRSSALRRAMAGGEQVWETADYLLALIADALHAGNWQRAGKKNAPKPKPIPRPGQAPKGERYGSAPIAVADFESWWDNPKGA